jgi:protein-S-isoprenylcysteine O-methyltransferase Ste14
MKRRLKVNGVIIFLVVLLVALSPHSFLRMQKSSLLDAAASIFGIAFMLSGQLLRACGRGYKSENSHNGLALIQAGPYTLVRNPMYLGILSIGLGIILVLFQWWVAVFFLIIFTLRYMSLIFKEEKKLSALFPTDYQLYLKKVPRIFPSASVIAKAELADCLPLKMPWIKVELGTVSGVLLGTILVKLLVDSLNNRLLICVAKVSAMSFMVTLFLILSIYLLKRTARAEKDVSNQSKNTL